MGKRKIALIGLFFAVFLASPLFISADIYSSNLKTGDSFLWRLRLSEGASISFAPPLVIVRDCLIQADITIVKKTGFIIHNVIMDVSIVGGVGAPENVSVAGAVYAYFLNKNFHIINILVLPTLRDDSSSFFTYMQTHGFTIQALSEETIVTYTSNRFIYDEKGVLKSYTYDNGIISFTLKRMMQISTIIALSVSGLVLLLAFITGAIVFGVRKARKMKEPRSVEDVKKAIIAQQKQQIITTPAGAKLVSPAGPAFPSIIFIVTFLLLTNVSDLLIKRSFSLTIFDPDISYFTNWELNYINFLNLNSSISAISISLIALISAIALSIWKTKSQNYKELLLKIPLYVVSLVSLASFVLTRVAVQISYNPLIESEEIFYNLLKSGLIFENIAIFFLLLALVSSAFVFEDSYLFSYKQPAAYVALIGLVFMFMAGINASNIFKVIEEIMVDPIYFEEFQAAYSRGVVFSELSALFLILALGIGLNKRAKKENVALWIVSILTTIVLGIIVFAKSLSLILFNLIEDYPTTEIFAKLYSRNFTLQIFKLIFLLIIIFFNIALQIKPTGIETGIVKEIEQEEVEVVQPVKILLCPICGEEVMEDSVFCSKCGAKITQASKREAKK